MDDPDPAMIRAAVAGDLAAFEQIVLTCQGPVGRYLRRFVGDPALAEDLTQETFIRIYRKLDTYRFGSRFTTWTFQIARNAAIDALRSRERRDRLVDAIAPPRPVSEPGFGAEISAALETLSPKLRDAVLLVEVAGFTYRDAADVLGVPTGTVKSRVFQARDQLVAWFEADDPDAAGRTRRGGSRREPVGAHAGGAEPAVEPMVLAEPSRSSSGHRADPDGEEAP